ncbi:MAG: helix-turn-helix transcriptional regulator [Deltaproteobacteria bacterium]|nr:helix-turn-helix transcriptional regulator [Deltaproteobacteria bacterium]
MRTFLPPIGDHLLKRRHELGLQQREVAERIGINEWTVANWEKRRTSPTIRHWPKVIEWLGYKPQSGADNSL